ncbi:unnamed protein product [Prorocentrum cordatum]|uniref:Membrane magnesium transporter n=1 Tax=Prorocentrum cordatum TaxID=2364126 RepID=A0ABN9SZ86_9DINO|nr:unnamed protein product [Polarella glacialis]
MAPTMALASLDDPGPGAGPTLHCGRKRLLRPPLLREWGAALDLALRALRTAVVWGVGLAVHSGGLGWRSWARRPASLKGSAVFWKAWTDYSLLEVAGFVTIILGQAIYGAMLRVPGLRYPPDLMEAQPTPSPGGMRNLAAVIQVRSDVHKLAAAGHSPGRLASPGADKAASSTEPFTMNFRET